MESVTDAPEESPAEECTCDAPFTLVRYRDLDQDPSIIDGVVEGSVVEGVFYLLGEEAKFLFAAPLDALLSIESIK